jgi:hypothetical protein
MACEVAAKMLTLGMMLAGLIAALGGQFLLAVASWVSRAGAGVRRTIGPAVVALAIAAMPLAISPEEKPARFIVAMHAIFLLTKLWDLHCQPKSVALSGVRETATYLVNWCFLTLRPLRSALKTRVTGGGVDLVAGLAVAVGMIGLTVGMRRGFPTKPLIVEHALNVVILAVFLVAAGRAITAVWRLGGGPARDIFGTIIGAATPAEFWRRWNRPTQEFLQLRVFAPAGGRRHPVRATLVTFAVSGLMHEYAFGIALGRVQGWQVAFFAVQGAAVAATIGVRPTGTSRAVAWMLTAIFNIATAVLFCASLDGVMTFYPHGRFLPPLFP